jgi:hypothetical protein
MVSPGFQAQITFREVGLTRDAVVQFRNALEAVVAEFPVRDG